MRLFLFVSPFVATIVLSATALGQLPAARDTARLDAVVVTATKSDAAPVVAAATVLEGAILRERGIATVADALRQVAGVHLARGGAPGATTSLFVRGGQSNYVKVLVDGVAVNDAGGFVDLANLAVANVARIEIVRGPASVLYGSDAVAGVVQIFTRRPAAATTVDASVRAGATTRKLGRLDGGLASPGRSLLLDASADAAGGSERLGWTLGAARQAHEGVLPFNNAWRNLTASGSLVAAPDEATRLHLTARLSDARFEYPTNGSGRAVDSNAVRDERRTVLGAEASRQVGERLRLALAAGAHELHGLSSDQPDSPGDSSGYYYRADGDNFRRTLEARADLRTTDASTLTVGVEGQWQGETSVGTSRFGAFEEGPTRFDERRRNLGWFAQLAGTRGTVAYSAGARVDDNEKFGTFGTWRLGTAWQAPGDLRLRASAGTAFREPSFIEVFNTAYTHGNGSLRPEHAVSWDAGIARTISWLTLEATYFDQRFRDMIQFRAQPFGSPEPNYFNVARATARGVELEARTDERRALSASGSVTALRTRVVDAGFQDRETDLFVRGGRLLRRPDRQARFDLRWRPSAVLRLDGSVTHVGRREDRGFEEDFSTTALVLPGYTKLDLGGELGLLARGAATPLSLTLRLENALNTSYEEIANFVAPGRVLLMGVRARVGR